MASNRTILALSFLRSRPERAAAILEQMDSKEIAAFLRDVPHTIAGPVIAFMLPQYAARILAALEQDAAAALLSQMNGRRAAAVLRYTERNLRTALIAKLPTKAASLLGLFLGYAEDMVGAWMIPDIMLLPDDCTVEEALARLSSSDQRTHGGIVHIMNRNAQLLGSVHVSTLLRQNADMPVSAIMEEEPFTLAARATLGASKDHRGWKSRNTLPVVNREKQLIGVLRHTDLHQGLREVGGEIDPAVSSQATTGFLDVYGDVLLALFGAATGLVSLEDN